MPRLADFAEWVTAAEPALGWKNGAFMAAFNAGQADAHNQVLEASPIFTPLIALLDSQPDGAWKGTATDLLLALDLKATEAHKRRKDWPRQANSLAGAVRRLAPNLPAAGIQHEETRDKKRGGIKVHAFTRLENGGNPSSPSSPSSPEPDSPEDTGSSEETISPTGIAPGRYSSPPFVPLRSATTRGTWLTG